MRHVVTPGAVPGQNPRQTPRVLNCQTMRYTASITKEGDLYVAQCLEIDVASQGTTVEEASANLQEALELYLERIGW
jgi:hypothetical protein